jgi:hypothetical protein
MRLCLLLLKKAVITNMIAKIEELSEAMKNSDERRNFHATSKWKLGQAMGFLIRNCGCGSHVSD